MCLGQTGNCGMDCSHGEACPTGTMCEQIHLGMGPTLGMQCTPTAAACDLNAAPHVQCDDGWSGYANNFFAMCRGCHTVGFANPSDIIPGAESIRMAIDIGDMPVGTTLSLDARRRILTWLSCAVHEKAPPSQ
jgi:hypothetical protein